MLSFIPVRTDGGVRVVKLPAASSASFVLRFLETMCRHLQCDNLFSSQPFSHYAAYDRTKSGKHCIQCREFVSSLIIYFFTSRYS